MKGFPPWRVSISANRPTLYIGRGLGRKLFAAFRTACRQDSAASFSRFASAETMAACANKCAWLVGPFHGSSPVEHTALEKREIRSRTVPIIGGVHAPQTTPRLKYEACPITNEAAGGIPNGRSGRVYKQSTAPSQRRRWTACGRNLRVFAVLEAFYRKTAGISCQTT